MFCKILKPFMAMLICLIYAGQSLAQKETITIPAIEVQARPYRNEPPGNPGTMEMRSPQEKTDPSTLPETQLSETTKSGLKRLKAWNDLKKALPSLVLAKLILDLIEKPEPVLLDQILKAGNQEWKSLVEILNDIGNKQDGVSNRIVEEMKVQISLEISEAKIKNDPNSVELQKEKAFWEKMSSLDQIIVNKLKPTIHKMHISTSNKLPEDKVEFWSPDFPNLNKGIYIRPTFWVKDVPFYGCEIRMTYFAEIKDQKMVFKWSEIHPGLQIPNSDFLLTSNHGLYITTNFDKLIALRRYYTFVDDDEIDLPVGNYKIIVWYNIEIDGVDQGSSNKTALIYEKASY